MEKCKDFGLSFLINIAVFSFLPLLHYCFHQPVSKIKPIEVEVVKLKKEKVKLKKKQKPKELKQRKIKKNIIKPELRRKITFELDPNALANEVDLIAPMVTYDLSEVEQLPQLIKYREPDYPFEASAKNMEGIVTLKILIDREGKVTMVKLLDNGGLYEFGQEATRVIRKWRFRPAKIMGMPVAVWCIQKICFELKTK